MDLDKYFIENILYPIMEKKKGNKTRKYIKELMISQSLTYEELRKIQEKKLKGLLLESIKNVPAYKLYNYLESEIEKDPFKALEQIPVLEKDYFRQNSETFINPMNIDRSKLIPNITGGSTGQPVKFYMDRKTVEHYEAARWRGLSWWDVSLGSRSVMIWGNPIELNQSQQKKYNFKEKWLKNRIIIPAYSLESKTIREYVKRIEKYKPEYFYGYSSALYAFASIMLKENINFNFMPKAVVSTAETLYDFQRETIEKAFGAKVVNEYGARDAGILAFECECGSMHISVENALLEVVDPITLKKLPTGQGGTLLVTDLNNLSMPRLRYRLGDSVTLSDEICKCKRQLPVLKKIEGREDDVFITPDGKLVHGHAFSHIARNIKSVKKFQIIQYSPFKAGLSIVVQDDYDQTEVNTFVQKIKEILPGTDIDVKPVDDIPLGKSGKYRYAIRDFDLEQGLKDIDKKIMYKK